MDYLLLLACVHASCVLAKGYCEKTKSALEVGVWKPNLNHMDSTVVESKPVSMAEGQMYVYENTFPGHTIKYIHVDNLAMKSCGARATVKSGGVGTSTLLVILHADSNQEIRSVVDIWGVKNSGRPELDYMKLPLNNIKSQYIVKAEPRPLLHEGFGQKSLFLQ